MKNLSIVLTLTAVLGMAGCDTGSTPQLNMPPPRISLNKEWLDECRELWTEQGISAYSFDVAGYKYDGVPYSRNTSPDVKFSAHITVADGGIVSIENIEPGELSFLYGKEMGAYTWGAIPDIFDKILSISLEEVSIPYPYAYDWRLSFDYTYHFPKKLAIELYTVDGSLFHIPLDPIVVLFEIENFQVNEPEQLEKWTKQGISAYSFDVAGYEYEPMTPFPLIGGSQLYTGLQLYPIPGSQLYTGQADPLPPDAQFCAHITVADGGIVSIENIEPGERPSMSISGMSISAIPMSAWSFSPDEGELGAYTWGAIPDIFDKIRSISLEEASSPYVYDRDITYDKKYGFPNYFAIEIYTWEDRELPPPYSALKGKGILLHKVLLLYIRNFKVTENAAQ